MKVAVTGASGLIGTALVESLTRDGHDVRRLVRRTPTASDEVGWDPKALNVDLEALAGTDAVVNLAGAGVGDKRWTPAYRAEVHDSRVNSTRTIAQACARLDPAPRVLVSGSAIGFYGDTGEAVVDETGPRGGGFLPEVVVDWERATADASAAGVRVVHARTGIVMSARGGTLGGPLPLPGPDVRLLTLFRLGLGGRLGSGRQWLSWISLADEIAAIRFLIDDERMTGPVNLTAPRPVRNSDWTRAIGRAVHRPTVFPVPAFALRGLLGDFADEGPLVSQRVLPHRLSNAGFTFAHPTIEDALVAEL